MEAVANLVWRLQVGEEGKPAVLSLCWCLVAVGLGFFEYKSVCIEDSPS